MAGPKLFCDIAIILGALILVADQQPDRCSCCLSLKNTGQDLNPVLFLALCDKAVLAGPPAVQIRLDHRL